MRLMLKIAPEGHVPFSKINKHTVQGMLYSQLKGSKFEELHRKKGFKFFTFSDMFPANDFYPGKEKTLILSSPNSDLISTWYNQFRKSKYLYLSDEPFKITYVKKFGIPLRNSFETGSPIVVYKENRRGEYFSFKRGGDLQFFMERVKENAIKKFNAFYDDEFSMDEPLFDRFVLRKEVAVNMKKEKDDFMVIGSLWKLLQKSYLSQSNRKFYKFVMDCGLGEKNSLGFGFLNPKKTG